jgi:hypothetical protein
MIGETITCENAGCDIKFVKRTHNQRYHDDECCRLATNAKIMEKYYQRRAQKLGLVRNCVSCGHKLSRYNSDTICNSCSLKQEIERNQSVASMLTSISWQS